MGLMLTSQGAGAFGMMEVGEWKIEFSGNVNAFVSDVKCEADADGPVFAGLACGSAGDSYDDNNIRTGLLPSWFGFHAERTEDNTKYGITIGFQPGIDGGNQGGIAGGPIDGALGLNSENLRQVFLEWSGGWGGFKLGRDLGLFGSDAILSDMTLLGVGTVSDLTRGGGNTSLGRIGVGYLYADWKGQVQYSSPKMGGFSFNLALTDPWGLAALSPTSMNSGDFSQEGSTYGIEGKASFAWGEGEGFNGKIWVSAINQSLKTTDPTLSDEDATAFDAGVKVGLGGLEVVAYAYDGEGIGNAGFLVDAVDSGGNARDSTGGYVQATFKFPGIGTKIGASYGESSLDLAAGDEALGALGAFLLDKNESIVVGIYHPLTSALNLVLEYTQTTSTAHNGNEAEETAIALGAILFY
jgi:predicted porin